MMVGRLEGRYLEMLTFALGATLGPRDRDLRRLLGPVHGAPAWPPVGGSSRCEISPVHAEFARRHIAASPYADRHRGAWWDRPSTPSPPSTGPFDLVFIDADKAAYPDYFEAVLPKLAPRGLIAADNTLWSGRILDPADTSEDTVALRAFNDAVAADPRVVVVQTTVRDGVTLIRRAG